ncbi:bifunctional hydroxymethylpyrimidine kinase/phosphomethylpyrimidine kinase [Xylanibacillus composti]|uniref:Hydroxymethylpyrimidine/phosphomethylpyrimidine kinase n=1 Tax=Xylanibacillus composti TaxID=1572762 RepID=A0A8J4M0E1_9BACL|nr:bifunctional hydroxymethylpyrimidine kinase/phosphomethylpyrimidine kinase [Xylanibacillus composti]MDT9723867.1 bifunctional hydroxymethylpyrimidine kinase/phosphomethylpyrimidine kinase [Xylanibacillus composti]GIQ67354.1 hydroxymethylpyrimidine/phosphomethylpyrimidine kinase [Xylanibacillus composti]
MKLAKAMTVAGSDSGGGAGIQADLKTFQELNAYGTSVVTALTAQNTLGVHGVYPQSAACVEAQLDAVLADIGVDAAKTGMLFSAEIIALTADKLKQYGVKQLVVDPVMIAKGGAPLLQRDAVQALKERLLPIATLVTPNIPEACHLLGRDQIHDVEQMREASCRLLELGAKAVLLKGGHLEGETAVDLFYDGHSFIELAHPRIHTLHTHGTGCTLSAAITAELAKGASLEAAVRTGKAFISAAIAHAVGVGKGIGPTCHAAYRLYR